MAGPASKRRPPAREERARIDASAAPARRVSAAQAPLRSRPRPGPAGAAAGKSTSEEGSSPVAGEAGSGGLRHPLALSRGTTRPGGWHGLGSRLSVTGDPPAPGTAPDTAPHPPNPGLSIAATPLLPCSRVPPHPRSPSCRGRFPSARPDPARPRPPVRSFPVIEEFPSRCNKLTLCPTQSIHLRRSALARALPPPPEPSPSRARPRSTVSDPGATSSGTEAWRRRWATKGP